MLLGALMGFADAIKEDLLFSMVVGGEGGIRTHGGRKPTTVFETATIDHSGTSPRLGVVYVRRGFSGVPWRLQALFRGKFTEVCRIVCARRLASAGKAHSSVETLPCR